jgi:hypothetical protein
MLKTSRLLQNTSVYITLSIPSSATTMPSNTLSRTTSSSSSTGQNHTYTAEDAASFSQRGASSTAMSPDEKYTLPSIKDKKFAPVTRKQEEVTYTAQDAAEFVRKGACMVVWPENQ